MSETPVSTPQRSRNRRGERMTRIIYEPEKYTVTLIGHADYDERGKDIVCAGITALTEAMLQRVKGRRIFQPAYGVHRKKAIVHVHLTPRTKYAAEMAREMLSTVCAGYREIARLYPDYVKFEER